MSKYPSVYGFLGITTSVKEQEEPGQRDAQGAVSPLPAPTLPSLPCPLSCVPGL